jgi:RHS repeat-associated protein
VGGQPLSASLVDINADGKLDLLLGQVQAHNNYVSVLLGDGSGAFNTISKTYSVSGRPEFLTLGDIDGDGTLDFVTKSFYGNISVGFGDSTGKFTTIENYAVDGGSTSVALGDLNGDGKIDLVSANGYDNTLSVLLSTGNRTFNSKVDYVVGRGATSVAIQDLNNDGKLDLISTNASDNTVSVLLGKGDGTFSAKERMDFMVGENPQGIALADLDLDGDIDFVTVNEGGNSVSPRLNGTIQLGTSWGTGDRQSTYDAKFNQLTREIDELGRQTIYEIDANTGNQLAVIRVVGAVGGDDDVITRYTYTTDGRMRTMTDALGRVSEYDYTVDSLLNLGGQLRKITFAKGTQEEATQWFEYDAAGNQTAVIDEEGRRTEYKYDSMNRLWQEIAADPDGSGALTSPITTYEYDKNGNQTKIIDARGYVTQNIYDSMNRLVKTIGADPDGVKAPGAQFIDVDLAGTNGALKSSVTTYTYDLAGNQRFVEDPLGRKTEYRYDARGRLIETIHPDGSREKPRYDFDDNQTASFDGNGNRANTIYDGRGRRIREIDALGHVTRFEYDAANQLIAQIDARGNRTQYKYDDLGRQIEVIDAQGQVTRTEYDQVGNVVAEIDALGHRTEYRYDQRDRRIKVMDANNTVLAEAQQKFTETKYDQVGNVQSIIDPVGNTTRYVYDGLNRLITETNELGKTRSYSYDAMGNRISMSDRNGRVREFNYDGLNRQTAEEWLDSAKNVIRTISSTYDAASQLTSMSSQLTGMSTPDSAYQFTYDLNGRLWTVSNAGTPGVPNVVLTYGYDFGGNVISVADTINGQTGATTSYHYDALNRVTQITQQATQITQQGTGVSTKRVDFDYNSVGQLSSLNRYTDMAGTQLVVGTSYTYDALNRLQDLRHRNANQTSVGFYNFGYDSADRITRITDIDGTTDYTYDDTNQLTGADHSNIADESYSYDANGNRTNAGYQTGSNNQLFSDGRYTYTYDDEGNLISRTEIATGDVREFTWDHRNRLVAVRDKQAGMETQHIEYTYDIMNRRVAKSVDSDGDASTTATTTRFVYDGDNVLLEFDGSSSSIPGTRYLHGPNVDQVLAQESSSNTVWHLADHLGTIHDLVGNNGAVVNHYTYDSFGNVVDSMSDATVDTRYKFTGREFDGETGLYYYRARYYDSEVGRFIGQDPIGFEAKDTNLYRYVENNPTSNIDPSGTVIVEFRLRRVAAIGTNAPGNHAYIVVRSTDCKGNRLPEGQDNARIYRGGPSINLERDKPGAIVRNVFKYGPLWGYVTTLQSGDPYTKDSVDYTTNPPFKQDAYRSKENSKPFHKNLLNTMIKIEQKKIPYLVPGPNSNSVVYTGFKYLPQLQNFKPPTGYPLPGWDIDLIKYTPVR